MVNLGSMVVTARPMSEILPRTSTRHISYIPLGEDGCAGMGGGAQGDGG